MKVKRLMNILIILSIWFSVTSVKGWIRYSLMIKLRPKSNTLNAKYITTLSFTLFDLINLLILYSSLCKFVQESQDHNEEQESVAQYVVRCTGDDWVYLSHGLFEHVLVFNQALVNVHDQCLIIRHHLLDVHRRALDRGRTLTQNIDLLKCL